MNIWFPKHDIGWIWGSISEHSVAGWLSGWPVWQRLMLRKCDRHSLLTYEIQKNCQIVAQKAVVEF